MLDPEYLERAGDLVCGVYSDMEADMCDVLVRAMLAGDISEWRAQTALALLAQGQAPQLRMVLERYRGRINKAVRDEVEAALGRSDAHDLTIVKRALGVELPKVTTQQVVGVVYTVCQMLERDNVDLMSGARDAFYRESSWAVTQVASGLMSPDEAVRQATRRLARGGIEMVQYRDPTTGDKTVRNHVDVAVRRHIRSQLQQACAERTMQVCELTGCEFVEVSSHYGARPSHQEWEGRVYSLNGRVTVDGKTYEDFGEGTGYYGTGPYAALGDRLCGVNCRHHWGPWFPGLPRAYHPNPRHPSGKSNAEIYDLTQRQRRLERGIRDTKRELKAAEAAYEADPTLKNQTEANKVRERLKRQQQAIHDLCEQNKDVLKRQANREGPIDTGRKVPRVAKSSQNREEKQRRRNAAQMEEVRRNAPESLAVPYETDEAKAVYGSAELASTVEPRALSELLQGVEKSALSDDPARRNATRLIARDVSEGRMKVKVNPDADTSHYLPGERTIELSTRGKASARTVAHEAAHLHDHQLNATYVAEKITQDGTELREFVTPEGQYATTHYGEERGRGMTLHRRLGITNRKGETAAWRDLKRRLGAKDDADALRTLRARVTSAGLEPSEASSLSDMLHAASNGRVRFLSGHRPKTITRDGRTITVPYWNESTRVIEAWADYGAALVTSPREAALMRELFPEETAIMEEIMEAMLK